MRGRTLGKVLTCLFQQERVLRNPKLRQRNVLVFFFVLDNRYAVPVLLFLVSGSPGRSSYTFSLMPVFGSRFRRNNHDLVGHWLIVGAEIMARQSHVLDL